MKALLRSFGYSFRGLFWATRVERNIRIHIVIMVYMFGFLLLPDWFSVTPVQWALLLLATALVVGAELLNTAIEATVNLVTEGRYHHLAGRAKDTASAAVLVCALFAVGVGIAVLWQPEAFRRMGGYFTTHPIMIGALAVSAVIAGVFVFTARPPAPPEAESGVVGVPTADRGPAEPSP
ncbi:MAG: diacylglycerol kinase family protein [Micromonosporaceae bacterium]|nr:diacylglycerol kinase family protein [Micromonosporaceae bacterium]